MIIHEFSFFLEMASRRIPIKKLRSRIRREMNEHMEDMLDDYLESGEEREAAIEKVIKDMGDPVKINKQLRRAHRSEIISAYIQKAVVGILIITFILSLYDISEVADEYRYSYTKEEIEADLAQSEYSYKYYGKIERNGRDYIIYTAETPEGYRVEYYESIMLFNRYSVYDRFSGSGGGKSEGNVLFRLGYPDISKEKESNVYFAFEETKYVKYFQCSFEKVYDFGNGNKPDIIKSELFPVPSPGEFTVIDAPDGYRFSGYYYFFDENKQEIQDSEKIDFGGSEGWGSFVKRSYLFW